LYCIDYLLFNCNHTLIVSAKIQIYFIIPISWLACNVFEINAGRAFSITAKGKNLKSNLQHFLE